MVTDETYACYPIHAVAYKSNPNYLHEVAAYLLEFNPAALRVLDGDGCTPLHLACEKNEKMNSLSIVQLLYNSWPEAIRMTGSNDNFPLHEFCNSRNRNAEDSADITVLRFMLDIDQTIVRERNRYGQLPLHYAVRGNSLAFCKVLIDLYPESIRIRTNNGCLPIHEICGELGDRADTNTIQYLLDLYPESINVRDEEGDLPIHRAAMSERADIVESLLKHDPEGASKKTTNNEDDQLLPLHLACLYGSTVEVVKILYDAYPDAIDSRDGEGKVPLEYARRKSYEDAVNFLNSQTIYARKAQDTTAMHTLDENGWLPLYHAIKDNAPLGSIKLLVKGNPSAIRTVDDNLAFPLHIACQFSTVKVVRHLVQLDSRIPVGRLDRNKDSVLHYACRGGNLEVITYLVDSCASLVSNTNADNKLPFHLLLECENEQVRESLEFTEVCFLLLRTYPETVSDLASRKRKRD